MRDLTLKSINRHIQKDIADLKKIETDDDELTLKIKRTLGYLYSVAIQGRKADIEQRLDNLEAVIYEADKTA
jgi:hypothetical protein